jgi:hypothetical protein
MSIKLDDYIRDGQLQLRSWRFFTRSWSGVGVDFFNPEWSWSGVALTQSGVQVKLELALFSNSDSTPTDIMTSKKTTKKLHRCSSVNALEERKIEIYKEKENFHND